MGNTIEIEVKLYHSLKRYLPCQSDDFSCKIMLPAGATISQVKDSLQIPQDIVLLAFANGVRVEQDRVLRTGDRLVLMQPAGGG